MKLSRDNDSKIRVTKEEKKAFDQMEKTQIIKNENIENELDKTYQNRQKMLGFTGEAQKSFQEQDDLDIKYSIQTQKNILAITLNYEIFKQIYINKQKLSSIDKLKKDIATLVVKYINPKIKTLEKELKDIERDYKNAIVSQNKLINYLPKLEGEEKEKQQDKINKKDATLIVTAEEITQLKANIQNIYKLESEKTELVINDLGNIENRDQLINFCNTHVDIGLEKALNDISKKEKCFEDDRNNLYNTNGTKVFEILIQEDEVGNNNPEIVKKLKKIMIISLISTLFFGGLYFYTKDRSGNENNNIKNTYNEKTKEDLKNLQKKTLIGAKQIKSDLQASNGLRAVKHEDGTMEIQLQRDNISPKTRNSLKEHLGFIFALGLEGELTYHPIHEISKSTNL